MIRKFHIWLWGVVMELEDMLYPWKTSTPPSWAIERHNLPDHHDDDMDEIIYKEWIKACLLYTSPSPRDLSTSRMPSSA